MSTTCTECGSYIFSLTDRERGMHAECVSAQSDLVEALAEKSLEDQLDTLLEAQ